MNTKTLSKPLQPSQSVRSLRLDEGMVASSNPTWIEKLKSAVYFLRSNAIGCEVFVRMMHDRPLSVPEAGRR